MALDLEKVCRIGIDRIVFSNIEFECPRASSLSIEGEDWIGEKVKIEESMFILEKTVKLQDSGKYSEWSTLAFNPNKVLTGSNIANSRSEELKEALVVILDKLAEKNITVDISRATVSEIEINFNLMVKFQEYLQVLALLFLNLQKLRKISNRQKTLSYSSLFKDSTLDGGWNNHGVRAYDKIEELRKESSWRRDMVDLPKMDLLRIEWWLLSSSYNYYVEKLGKKNTLVALLEDDSIIDTIFRQLSHNKLFQDAYVCLEKELVPTLEVEYKAFKDASRLAREKGRRAPRDVYKHLIEKYWVFDYQDLIDLVIRHDNKHKGREIKRIKEKYFHLNNRERLSYLVENIFPHYSQLVGKISEREISLEPFI